MSDLVKRLRKYANMPYSGPIHDTCGEAADEIERLRGDTSTYEQVQVNEYEDEPKDFDVYREEVWKNEHS